MKVVLGRYGVVNGNNVIYTSDSVKNSILKINKDNKRIYVESVDQNDMMKGLDAATSIKRAYTIDMSNVVGSITDIDYLISDNGSLLVTGEFEPALSKLSLSTLSESKFALRAFSKQNTITNGVIEHNVVEIIAWDLVPIYKKDS